MTGYTIDQELTDASLDRGTACITRKDIALKTARKLAADRALSVATGEYTDVFAYIVSDCQGQTVRRFKTGAKMGPDQCPPT
jgi:hypothetical protein